MSDPDEPDPPLRPGDRVVHRSTGEKGVVVWTWVNEQEINDCYVAFFGDAWPERQPRKPYVLRYYAASLARE
jgi:hypothetical protein